MPRPATGQTPNRNLRSPDEIWEPALENAKAEGKSLAKVINEFLVRYNAEAERKRRQEEHGEASTP